MPTGQITYRTLQGSLRHKDDEGPYSIPHTRVVADVTKGNGRKRVGTARILSDWRGGPYLDMVHVDPEWQGRGIGGKIMQRLMERTEEDLKGKTVKTRASPYDNEPLTRKELMKFYGKHGFKPAGVKGVRVGKDDEGRPTYATGTGPGALEKKGCEGYTDAMVKQFEKRTKEHIDRVVANMKKVGTHPDFDAAELTARGEKHDQSKYGKIERDPYIWNTEMHRCKNCDKDFKYPDGVEEQVREATGHHINSNKHHPQAHGKLDDMTELDLIEMVCDWAAMAQELGEGGGSAKGWADKNVGTKWKFSDCQKKFIYKIIDILDEVAPGVKKRADFAPGLPQKKDYGDLAILQAGQLLPFVRQQHDAYKAGPHEDWRFGRGKMFSFAVPKGKPEFGQKHLALQQGLHREGYKHFQGEIPRGQYGGGKVSQTELGDIMITGAQPGKITFTTAGKKDAERFALVRLASDAKKWLLVNTTPQDVLKYKKVRYHKLDPKDVEQLFSPEFAMQPKLDGALTFYSLLGPKMESLSYRTTKAGKPIVHTEQAGLHEVAVPKELQDTVLAGETIGVQGKRVIHPRELTGLLNSTIKRSREIQQEKNIQLKNMLFNVMRYKGKDIPQETPYLEKRKMLEEAVSTLGSDKFMLPPQATTPDEQMKMFESIRSGKDPLTREGAVFHPLAGGAPTKVKFRPERDVVIRGMFPGTGKLAGRGVGGFEYSHEPEGPIVGKVGTGFSNELRELMHADPESYINRVARVKAQEEFPSGALRAPSLISLHEG